MTRTWKANAKDFAALDRGDGWPFALLVACSVELQSHGGDRRSSNNRYLNGKTSVSEFAKEAQTSAPRVKRYLDAWQRAAKRGWVPDATTLVPADVANVTPPDKPWKARETGRDGETGVYNTENTGGPSSVNQVIRKAQTDPEYADQIRKALPTATPTPEEKRQQFLALSEDDDVRDDVKTRHAGSANLQASPESQRRNAKQARNHERSEAEVDSKFPGLALSEVLTDLVEARKILRESGERLRGMKLDAEDLDAVQAIYREVIELAKHDLDSLADDWDSALADLTGLGD